MAQPLPAGTAMVVVQQQTNGAPVQQTVLIRQPDGTMRRVVATTNQQHQQFGNRAAAGQQQQQQVVLQQQGGHVSAGAAEAATAAPFQPAPVPYILRAVQKDASYRHKLSDHMTDAASALIGTRFAAENDKVITRLAAVCYDGVSAISGQTLGEEYADLLPVDGNMMPLTATRRAVMIILGVVLEITAKKILRKYLPDLNADEVVANLAQFHLGMFYFFQRYFHFLNRLVGVQHAYLGNVKPDANQGYMVLGSLCLLQDIITFVRWYRRRRAESATRAARGPSDGRTLGTGAPTHSQRFGGADGTNHSHQNQNGTDNEDEEEDEDEDESQGRCMLCLGARRSPAATPCGHIFCWECVMAGFGSAAEAPCPLCRQPMTPQSVLMLKNYAVPESLRG